MKSDGRHKKRHVNWINLAQDTYRWLAVVHTVTRLWVSQQAKKFLTDAATDLSLQSVITVNSMKCGKPEIKHGVSGQAAKQHEARMLTSCVWIDKET